MAKSELHVQCELRKSIKNGEQIQVAWIPKNHARLGHIVKLKEDDDSWDDGWKVTEVSQNNVLASKLIQERSMGYKKMRQRTDI